MKLFLSFLLFVAVFQFGTSYLLSKRGTQEQLSSDTAAVQNGSDVMMVKPGPLEVVLNNANELAFEVCSMKCTADYLVCYAPHFSNQNVLEDSCDTNSGFYITTFGDTISFMELISSRHFGVGKSDQFFAPKGENGIVNLNIIIVTSDRSVSGKSAIIKLETATLGQLNQTLLGGNEHASAATTDEPESFFADYWWIILILGIILIGIEVGVCCYLRRKKNAQKPTVCMPARRRKLRESQSPVVSTETQKGKTESGELTLWQRGRTEKREIIAIIEPETRTAPPATTSLGQLDHTLSGKNAATTDEPENFFADYCVYCYLRRKKKSQKPLPVRRRKLQGSKSPVVFQPSTETQQRKTESAVLPNSLYQQSSILSHKSLLYGNKEEAKKAEPESTDLTSMKPTA
uniref:Uncharacterized protein n=1 Tax=Panagrolaimus davidi TaxID=227884 RepID=A0A914PKM8_9BILA